MQSQGPFAADFRGDVTANGEAWSSTVHSVSAGATARARKARAAARQPSKSVSWASRTTSIGRW